MKVSRMTRYRSESISSSSLSMSSLSSASHSGSASLHQAKSLDSLDRDESSESLADSELPHSWRRKDFHPNRSHHPSTMTSCESSVSSSSCCWSQTDGQSSSSEQSQSTADSSSLLSGSSRHRDRARLVQSHPKQQGVDSIMLTIFRCCLDRRLRPSSESDFSSSRWTKSPEYGKLQSHSSSTSISCRSSNDSLAEPSRHVHAGLTGTLITKVPNQR